MPVTGIRLTTAVSLVPMLIAASCNTIDAKSSSNEKQRAEPAEDRRIVYVEVPRDLTCRENFDLSYVGGRIRNSVLFGMGDPPDCILPAPELPILVEPYQIGLYWTRAVSAKDPENGVGNVLIRFSIVSEEGAEIDEPIGFVSPLAITEEDGVRRGLQFLFTTIGVYRIAMDYPDGARVATVYSPPIIVLPPDPGST